MKRLMQIYLIASHDIFSTGKLSKFQFLIKILENSDMISRNLYGDTIRFWA